MVDTVGRKRFMFAAALLVAPAIAAAGFGVLSARQAGHDSDPLRNVASGVEAQPSLDYFDTLPQLQAPDPEVEFPPSLRGLTIGAPEDVAVDSAGQVWFMSTGTPSWKLYRYDPAADTLESLDVSFSHGSPVFLTIEVDGHGHVILGSGRLVVDFDPATRTYRNFSLDPPENTRWSSPGAGPVGAFPAAEVNSLALADQGRVYVSWEGFAAITEVNLGTGEARAIPYPLSFGHTIQIVFGDGSVWMVALTSDAQTTNRLGRLDPVSGELTVTGRASRLFVGPGGRVYATTVGRPGIVALDRGGSAPAGHAGLAASMNAGTDLIAEDPRSSAMWATFTGSSTVSRFDPATNSVRTYKLPVYLESVYPGPNPSSSNFVPSKPPIELGPAVGGIAVAPNGDLYFTAPNFGRIGVIRAGP